MRDNWREIEWGVAEDELLICHTRVLILALDDNGEVIVLSKPVADQGGWVMEMPEGDVLYREEPRDAALRVLLTETGYLSENLEPIGRYVPKGSVIDVVHLFSASDLVLVRRPFQLSYDRHLFSIGPSRLGDMIQKGVFRQEAGIKAFTNFFLGKR